MQNRKPLSAAFEKIANSKKVNLESQKVELALIDDLKTRFKALSKDTNRLLSFQNEYFKIQRGMRTLIEVLENSLNAQSKDVAKAISAAKELGIDNKEFFQYEKQIQEIFQEVKSIKSKIK